MRISPASGSVPEPLRVTGAPWATLGLSGLRPPRAPHQSHLFLGSCLRGIAGHPPRRPLLKSSPSRSLPSLSALTWRAGPPTFSGTSIRLLDAKRTLPPLLARLLKSVAFASGVAKDEYGKNGLCLLPIFDRALCLVPLVQSALLAFGQLM